MKFGTLLVTRERFVIMRGGFLPWGAVQRTASAAKDGHHQAGQKQRGAEDDGA
jgi:hypothetical protein